MLPTTIISLIFSIVLIQNIGANDPYPDAVVSLWRLDSEGKVSEKFLYVAALIKSNCILVLQKFLYNLEPFNTLGFYTGRSHKSGRMENSAIIGELGIPRLQNFRILVVKPDVKLQTPYIMTNNLYSCGELVIEDSGYFIGWHKKNGPQIKEVSFRRKKQIRLITKVPGNNSADFPMGSFIVKSNTIVGISYCITALMERRFIQPFKISEEFLQNICEKSSELQEAGEDPYPDAVVSFWRLKEEIKELLYVGFLIESNWILFPRDFYETLKTFKNIILHTGRKYKTETHRPIKSIIVEEKEIPGTNRFIILVMEPGIRLPTPYTVTNSDTYRKTEYSGDFIGWKKTNEVERKEATLVIFQGFHFEFKDKETTLENFPLGSFMVKGKEIIAVLHNITKEGELQFLQLFRHESEELSKLFKSENNPDNKRILNSLQLAKEKKRKMEFLH